MRQATLFPRRCVRKPRRWHTRLELEPLETRTVPTGLTVGPNVNLTRLVGNEAESTIAINPTNPQNLFAAFNPNGSTWARYSTNGGATWTNSNTSAVPFTCCDNQAAWDSFGNLFVTYLGASGGVYVARSVDGGATLIDARTISSSSQGGDQPSIAVGPGPTAGSGSVWVSFERGDQIVASGALVNGLGSVGAFTSPQIAPGTTDGSFGGTAIGPTGQLMVVSVLNRGRPDEGPNNWIRINLDPDGLGPAGFSSFVQPTTTNVGSWDTIPAHPGRTIGSEPNLAWDRSGGPNHGRVYLVYLDEPINESNDTVVLLRYSDDNGTTWSSSIRVDDDPAGRSQFMPALALDQTSGNLAITWYDARNSPTNITIQMFGAVSFDGGATFSANVQISAGTSNATVPAVGSFNFGDYDTMDFHNGVFYRTWADNSNSTGDNPGGTLGTADIYTARVVVGNSVRGIVYNDVNGNGTREAGEPGLAGWTVRLDLDDNGTVDRTVTTGADGGYSFSVLPLGTHRLLQVVQAGWAQTAPAAEGSHAVVIDSAIQQISGRDFGNRLLNPGSISGVKFHDQNADGVRQAAEPLLSGWTIYIDANNNGILDTTEQRVVTSGTGTYSLGGLAPGEYIIREVAQTGWSQSAPSPSPFHAVTLGAGENVTNRDFGNYRPATVSGTAYHDLNGDGLRQLGEPPLSGWTVYYDVNENGVLDQTITTLEPDAYAPGADLTAVIPQARLRYLAISGGRVQVATSSLASTGTRIFGTNDPTYAPEFFQGGNYELRIEFTSPALSLSIDAIAPANGRIGRLRIYNASNQLLDTFTTSSLSLGQRVTMTLSRPMADIAYALASSDNFITGILLDNLSFLNSSEPTALTGTNGSYTLGGIRPGSAVIRQVVQPNWQETAPPGGIHSVSLASGQTVLGLDFGNQSGAVRGQLYRDTNGNGIQDPGETGLAGWIAYVDLNNNGMRDAGEPARTTDAAGNYFINGLAVGTHVVREVVNSGWQQTAPAAGFHSAAIGSPSTIVNGLDFGNFEFGSVRGIVFQDLNGDGIRQASEPLLPGWTIYNDLDNDGMLDIGTVSFNADDFAPGAVLNRAFPGVTLSYKGNDTNSVVALPTPAGSAGGARVFGGSTGSFYDPEFYNDPGGSTWWLRIDFANPVSNVTIDAIGTSRYSGMARGLLRIYNSANELIGTFTTTNTLAGGELVTMTLSRPSADIAYAFASSDQFNEGVLLDNLRFSGASEPLAITDAQGVYELFGLRMGNNVIRAVLQPNWVQTAPASGFHTAVITTSGEGASDRDFGNRSGTITGTTFADTNADGLRNAGEPSLAGWTVYLDLNNNDRLDPGEPSRVTNLQGNYLFNGLAPGTYQVRQIVQAGWQQTVPSRTFYSVTILDTTTVVTSRDFGSFRLVSISGVKFQDFNGDGIRQANEPLLPGWTVYADVNENGSLDQTSVTTTLEPDDYAVGADLTDVIPQARLRYLAITGGRVQVATSSLASTGTRIFGTNDPFYAPEFFQGGGYELRIDFASPASSVSIDAIAPAAGRFGRLRIYDANNQLLNTFTTTSLGLGQRATMTLSRPTADIAYALASSDNFFTGILLDNLRFSSIGGEPSAVTDANGAYSIPGFGPGTHVIREVLQPNWQQTAPADGFHAVAVTTSGQNIVNVNFGNQSATITGVKYRDNNGNGVRDAGELGLNGWRIYLDLNASGTRDAGEPFRDTATVNGVIGTYVFNGLAPGDYIVREELLAGWRQITPEFGYHVASLADMASVAAGLDFGNFQNVTVSGVKFNDYNGDGVRQANEPGVAGWVIYDDMDQSGTHDAGEPFTITTANGTYTFSGLGPGVHRIRSAPQLRWADTLPGSGVYVIQGTSGLAPTNQNFASRRIVNPLDIVDDGDFGFRLTGQGWITGTIGYQGDQRTHISSTTPPGLVPNGSFETQPFASWTTAGNATNVATLGTIAPTLGARQALLSNGTGTVNPVSAASLQTFLGLDVSLNSLGNGNVVEGSALRQTITANVGDRLSFRWNFLTSESTPSFFNDFAFVSLTPAGGGPNLLLATLADTHFNNGLFLAAGGTGFLQQTGYQLFTYTFTVAGSYVLGIGVVDVGAASINSGLLLDEVRLGPANDEGTASWFSQGEPGLKEIFVTWTANPANATEARYLIYDGVDTLLDRVIVNQRVAPNTVGNSVLINGAVWVSLGIYESTTGFLWVVLSDVADGTVVADAVLISDAFVADDPGTPVPSMAPPGEGPGAERRANSAERQYELRSALYAPRSTLYDSRPTIFGVAPLGYADRADPEMTAAVDELFSTLTEQQLRRLALSWELGLYDPLTEELLQHLLGAEISDCGCSSGH